MSSLVRAVPVALLCALAVPTVAQANATLSVTGTAPQKVLTFTVDDALDHSTGVWVASGDIIINDVGVSVGASGCTAVDGYVARCGPASDFERVVLNFGAGDDVLDVPYDTPMAVSVDGGAGDDEIHGGAIDDRLVGGGGDDALYGAGGDDQLYGGVGGITSLATEASTPTTAARATTTFKPRSLRRRPTRRSRAGPATTPCARTTGSTSCPTTAS